MVRPVRLGRFTVDPRSTDATGQPSSRATKRRVVVASDAAHFYANIEEDRPFSIVTDLPQMYGAFDIIRKLAPSPEHIIPGHDPLVMERYPAARPELAGIVARLG
jgi:glyoxylase-like metal-dependent hydrolase (beta-lactamase superfamily II)